MYVVYSAGNMRIVTGDYSVRIYEGTEQYRMPLLLIPHPQFNKTSNNADIMLIKVRDHAKSSWVRMTSCPGSIYSIHTELLLL